MQNLKGNEIFKTEYELLEDVNQLIESPELKKNAFYPSFNRLLRGYKKLLHQSVSLVNISDKQQERLYKLQSDLKSLMDNTGQGIFSVNQSLRINKGYSSECLNIFGQPIEGKKFSDLIRPDNDEDKVTLIEAILNDEFFWGDELQQHAMLQLLPEEISVRDRVFRVKYNPVILDLKEQPENVFMIILNDITEKKALQKTRDDEKQVYKAITKIITDPKTFSRCVHEYRSFYQQKVPGLDQKNTSCENDVIDEICRDVHTLKGNFAVFEIPRLVDFLEEVEQSLIMLRENGNPISCSEIARLIDGYDFGKSLQESLNQLYRAIGNSWIFEDDFVMVKAKDLKRLESEAHKVAPAVAAEIRKICYMDVVQMLVLYPEYTQRLAERLEKQIAPFDIECPEEIKVDPERYQAFFRSLVHVFRNMVDHGIESQEERSAASKDLSGTIRCLVSKLENGFKITITDDGRGIDIDKLKERAVQQGLITPEKALKMPFSQSLELVFLNGLTTARHPNGISGRGFGLAVLKEETERLGGTIEISTKPGEGTCFVFQFTDEPSQSKFNI